MHRRSVRIACLVVGLLATAGLTYRALQDEDTLNSERQAAVTGTDSAIQTVELLHELRASLHAYVAPGQGLPFWSKRAQDTLNTLRGKLDELDQRLSTSGGSLNEALDAVDQLTASERRARTYAGRGEMQLAGDVIFTEIRDLLATATSEVQAVRYDLLQERDRRSAAVRQEQFTLAGAALGIWIAIAILLLPAQAQGAVKDPAEWRNELKQTLKKPIPVTPVDDGIVSHATVVAALPPAASSSPETLAAIKQVAEICSDLSALAGPGALEGALARVNTVLNATGLIVWVAANDSNTLSPVATHGFDPKLVARIGKINRDGSNLTATAFRQNEARISATTAAAPGAIAVPLCSPAGPAGVLSVELKAGQNPDETKVALSAIIAAQLATLAMPIVSEPAEYIEEPRRAAL